ncbi:hypothetical protein ABK040_008884 [Willaertia magna]
MSLKLLLFFVFFYSLFEVYISLSSKITTCLPSETDCKSELQVTISLSSGGRQDLSFTLSQTKKENGEAVDLEPIDITITKTPPKAVYPLIYVQTFNGKPTENIIYKNDFLVPSCVDSATSKAPTCGWIQDNAGKNVEGSQGFCCSCSVGQMFGGSERTRGSLNCGFLQMRSSAHCMRMDEVFWNAYELEAYSTKFDIKVASKKESLTVNPSKKIVSNGQMRVELSGDFSVYKSIPLFESKYLFIPVTPSYHPTVLAGKQNWMLIDKSMVTLGGTECNKIGVSYNQFRNQPNACSQLPLACLANQIEDLRQDDLKAMGGGKKSGKYIISNYGSFSINSTEENEKVLTMDIEDDTSSQINIFIDADSVVFVNYKSLGGIVKAWVDKFESMSREGTLHAIIINKGNTLGKYVVTITECSSNILPITQKSATLDPGQSLDLIFSVRTNLDLDYTNQCKVSLLHSDGEKIEETAVVFDSSAYVAKNGSLSQSGVVGTESDKSVGICVCGSPFDLICIVLHGCTDYIIGWVVGVVLIITTPILLIFMWRCGCCGMMMQWCKCCACCCALLPKGVQTCLIKPYKNKQKKKKKNKKKKKKEDSTSESDSTDESEKKKKKKKKKRNHKKKKKKYNEMSGVMSPPMQHMPPYNEPYYYPPIQHQTGYGRPLPPVPRREFTPIGHYHQ